MAHADDPFAAGEYRRLIGWDRRLARERPFLERFLAASVAPRVLDLGCGSGEHAAWFSERGVAAVGVDQSAGQIASARELCTKERPDLQFVQASFGSLSETLSGQFGGAICLGNVLPFLDWTELRHALADWALLLLPGAPLWIQLLNYAGLRAKGVRHLPLLPSEVEGGGEQVLLRWMRFLSADEVLFYPTNLQFPADESEPKLVRARAVRLRTWSAAALQAELPLSGFEIVSLYGSVEFAPYDAGESQDLIVCARRS